MVYGNRNKIKLGWETEPCCTYNSSTSTPRSRLGGLVTHQKLVAGCQTPESCPIAVRHCFKNERGCRRPYRRPKLAQFSRCEPSQTTVNRKDPEWSSSRLYARSGRSQQLAVLQSSSSIEIPTSRPPTRSRTPPSLRLSLFVMARGSTCMPGVTKHREAGSPTSNISVFTYLVYRRLPLVRLPDTEHEAETERERNVQNIFQKSNRYRLRRLKNAI